MMGMKYPILYSTGALFLWCTGLLYADLPLLEYKGLLQSGAGVLTVQMQAFPSAVDWNNDGKKDLIVGEYTGGNIHVYLNKGTDVNPAFNGSFMVLSNGAPISVSYG